jgi:hypothetical protein
MTVLTTLNTRFKQFTLSNLIAEVTRWAKAGVSVFEAELAGIEKAHAPPIV